MIEDSQLENFQQQLEKVKASKDSASSLLEDIGNKYKQKKHIVDSFLITNFHRNFKKWYQQHNSDFLEEEVAGYNRKLGQMTRLDHEVENLTTEFENKSKLVTLPDVSVSISAIKQYDEKLLDGIPPEHTEVNIGELFSLDGGKRPKIDKQSFEKLMNIEYRLRIEQMIQYEILKKIKRELMGVSQKWSQRDKKLKTFMSSRVREVIREVNEIRESEKVEEDIEEEDEEDEINEVAAEIEEDEEDNEDAHIEFGDGDSPAEAYEENTKENTEAEETEELNQDNEDLSQEEDLDPEADSLTHEPDNEAEMADTKTTEPVATETLPESENDDMNID